MSQDKSTTTRLDSPHSPGLTFKKEETASRARLALTVCGLLLTLLLAALDQTIVGTALPRIIADLGGFDHVSEVSSRPSLRTRCSGDLNRWHCRAQSFGSSNHTPARITVRPVNSATPFHSWIRSGTSWMYTKPGTDCGSIPDACAYRLATSAMSAMSAAVAIVAVASIMRTSPVVPIAARTFGCARTFFRVRLPSKVAVVNRDPSHQ